MRVRLLLVCAFALSPLALWGLSPLVSTAATPRSLSDVQSQIQSKQHQIGKKKGTERVLTSTISGYTSRINRLQGRISVLQGQQSRIQSDLDAKRAELVGIQSQLRSERARLTRLQARLIVSRRALAGRLVEIYKAGSPDLVTIVFTAKNFSDLMEQSEFLRRISESDRKIVAAVRDDRAQAATSTRRLAALEQRQQAVAATILQRRDQVAGVKGQLVSVQSGFQQTRAGKQRVLSQVRAQRQNLEGDLTVLRSAQAKIQARLAQIAAGSGSGALPAGPIQQGSGTLIWPVNGPITSPFCERRAWEACHPGIDIGVPAGTPIRAAGAGRVVLMQPVSASGGYGNFTCIQHTASMSTCYAHQSSFATSMGATVAQGEVIGYVGCTGRCFGDHLHFEVRINGQVTNPMNYL